MYQDILRSKWENLEAELNVELKSKGSLITLERLNEWYKVKAFQFRSINSVDSLQLEQAGSKEFVTEFLSVLDCFSFSNSKTVSSQKTLPKWLGIPVGLVAGAISFFSLKLLIPALMANILSVLIFAGFFALYTIFVNEKSEESNQSTRNEEYMQQFAIHLNRLLEVCEKHGVK